MIHLIVCNEHDSGFGRKTKGEHTSNKLARVKALLFAGTRGN